VVEVLGVVQLKSLENLVTVTSSLQTAPSVARRSMLAGACALALASWAGDGAAQQQPDLGIAPVTLADTPYVFDTAEQHKIRVSVIARGLAHPFSLAFLPNGDALIVERNAALRIVRHAAAAGDKPQLEAQPVAGAPPAGAYRGVGLFEVAVHPQFATNKLVYFTYNKAAPGDQLAKPQNQRESQLVVARATFDGKALHDAKDLLVGGVTVGSSGSRLAFAADGMLYVTTGAPFNDAAQDVGSVYGKVLRIKDDGTIPKDNPFVGKTGARPEVLTLGHRDQLGLTVHAATGSVLNAEHGPNGGDEINLILPGHNYGWPKWSFGRNYDGPRISAMPLGDGIDQPLILWLPSIAPTGLTFYTGDKLAAWRGNLFIGSARTGEIPRTGGLERVVLNDKLEELRRERLLTDLHQRIRDVRQGPDGLLYVVTDEDDGALLRIEPAGK
jgi:glucose/arabinose dehydrogenase